MRLDLGNGLMRPGIVFRGKRGDSQESNASAVSAGSDEADRASPRPKSARPKSWDKMSSARILFFCFGALMRRPSVLCLGGFFRGKRTDSQDSNASAGSAGSDEGDGITIIRSRGKSQDKNLGAAHVLGFPLQSVGFPRCGIADHTTSITGETRLFSLPRIDSGKSFPLNRMASNNGMTNDEPLSSHSCAYPLVRSPAGRRDCMHSQS